MRSPAEVCYRLLVFGQGGREMVAARPIRPRHKVQIIVRRRMQGRPHAAREALERLRTELERRS